MKMSRVLCAAALLSAGLFAPVGRAAEPTKEEAEKSAAVIGEIALAGELASLGRGHCEGTSPKDFKSPESLVLAGGILLRAHKATQGKVAALDSKPTDDKGNPLKGDAKSVGLDKQAEALFDEASAMAAEMKDKGRAAAVEAMIKREKSSEPDRGGVGGPKTITRTLQPGETHTYPLAFFSGQPAAITMTSTGPPKIQIDLTHVGGASLLSMKSHNANYGWTPANDKNNIRRFTLTLTNNGNKPTTYTLSAN